MLPCLLTVPALVCEVRLLKHELIAYPSSENLDVCSAKSSFVHACTFCATVGVQREGVPAKERLDACKRFGLDVTREVLFGVV